MGGKASPEVIRKASATFYQKNREAIRERRNAAARENPRQKDRTTIEERARNKLRQAVWNGSIIKPSVCNRCDWEGVLHGHHEDYSKPLDVEWLCPSCHNSHHFAVDTAIARALGTGNPA